MGVLLHSLSQECEKKRAEAGWIEWEQQCVNKDPYKAIMALSNRPSAGYKITATVNPFSANMLKCQQDVQFNKKLLKKTHEYT